MKICWFSLFYTFVCSEWKFFWFVAQHPLYDLLVKVNLKNSTIPGYSCTSANLCTCVETHYSQTGDLLHPDVSSKTYFQTLSLYNCLPGPVQPAVTVTTQEDGVLPPESVSVAGRHAALVLGSKVRQWFFELGSLSKARSCPPLWPLNFLWTTTCSGVRRRSDPPTITTYRDGSLPNLQERDRSNLRVIYTCVLLRWVVPLQCRNWFINIALDLPGDTVCRRQGPAGADQSATAERTAVFFLRPKPHRHLPWPRGPEQEERTDQNDFLLLFLILLPFQINFCSTYKSQSNQNNHKICDVFQLGSKSCARFTS